jgi:hypothetical protein
LHQFTHNDTHEYKADEVLTLIKDFYVKGKAKGRMEAHIATFRVWATGALCGAGCVLLYQVIA